jgi:hypothetical protein
MAHFSSRLFMELKVGVSNPCGDRNYLEHNGLKPQLMTVYSQTGICMVVGNLSINMLRSPFIRESFVSNFPSRTSYQKYPQTSLIKQLFDDSSMLLQVTPPMSAALDYRNNLTSAKDVQILFMEDIPNFIFLFHCSICVSCITLCKFCIQVILAIY